MSRKTFRMQRTKRSLITFLMIAMIANGAIARADSVTPNEIEVYAETSEENTENREQVPVEDTDSVGKDNIEDDTQDEEDIDAEYDNSDGNGDVVVTEVDETVYSDEGSELAPDNEGSIDDAEQQEEKTEGNVSGDWQYYNNSNGTIYISRYLGSAKDVVIPATIDGKKVYSVKCLFDSNLRTAVISNGIKEIGDSVFNGCKKLTKVTIPSSVNKIGAYAFRDCVRLTQVNIPMGTTSIEYGTFYNCSGITSFNLPASITVIDDVAFSGCTGITAMNLPFGVTKVDDGAFKGCTNLKSIVLPQSITYIGNSSFEDCSSLSSITIPSGVEYIGSYTFDGCRSLKSVVIHNNIENVGFCAFRDCVNLSYVEFQYMYTTIDGSYSFKNTNPNMIIFCPQGSEAETFAKNNNFTYLPLSYKSNPFKDVAFGKYYSAPVLWAYHSSPQITNGTSSTLYSPNNPCTRAQTVTFLWNACGRPQPKNRNNPFVDVSSSSYYYNAVLWAVEKGITAGKDAKHFAPGATCTRAEFVTFLWRLCGSPKVGNVKNPFTGDVARSHYFYDAVIWASNNGVAAGIDSTHFSPYGKVSRAQAVTFLFRGRTLLK